MQEVENKVGTNIKDFGHQLRLEEPSGADAQQEHGESQKTNQASETCTAERRTAKPQQSVGLTWGRESHRKTFAASIQWR